MNDEKFDYMMDDINLSFFWHELGKDREAKEYYPSTHARSKVFQFYVNHIRSDGPLHAKLTPRGVKAFVMIRDMMDLHADGIVTAREVLQFLSELASQKEEEERKAEEEADRNFDELRERSERKEEAALADRNFKELMDEEDALKSARKKKKCKRKSKSQRRKPPAYEPNEADEPDEPDDNSPPPPAYTPN